MRERPGGPGEIDEDVARREGGGDIGPDACAPGARRQLARIAAGMRRARELQRGGDRGARVGASRLEERAPHAPARTRDREADRAHFGGAAPAAERVGPPSTRTIFSFSKYTANLFCSTSRPRFSLRK